MNNRVFEKIKQNVFTRCAIATETGIGLTHPDKEELELIKEVDRLKDVIKRAKNYVKKHSNNLVEYLDVFEVKDLLEILEERIRDER